MTIERGAGERGMTLLEMLLALFVFSFVMAGALSVLRNQSKSFSLGTERIAMYQNTRYALTELEKDLRTAGAGVSDNQPQLIYAGTNVVAFNANYWTNTPGDIYAVYYDPDAPDSAVQALTQPQKMTIPLTSFGYPDTSYTFGAGNSAAETIIFYFSPDTTTSRTDDYVLYRQVNNLAPEVVGRNILATAGVPFFQYYAISIPLAGGNGSMFLVPTANLPYTHSVKVHLALNDTGPAARIDSIRAVRVSFTETNERTAGDERLRTISRMMRLPNAGLVNKKDCGDPPILGAAAFAATYVVVSGAPTVKLTWLPATDEYGGETDIERYVIWRRVSTNPLWGDPYVSVPAGSVSYTYSDATVSSATSYYYALAAEDCTPNLSTQMSSAIVSIP
jgi:prepilin-type N-terminal cleavage/methylation domain-containing protein